MTTRRNFLKLAGAGCAAAGAASVLPVVLRPGESGQTAANSATVAGPLMAYVRDVSRGDIVIMAGEQEYAIRDPALAARLSRVAR